MNDITKILKLLKESNVLINGITDAAEHTKKQQQQQQK